MTPGNTSYMVIVPSPVSFFIWKTAQRSLCATGINELFHRIVSVNLSHPFVFYYSIFSKRSKAYCKISLPYPYINRFVNQWISLATTSSVTVQFAGRFIESPMDYQSVIESIPIVVGWFLFKSSSIAGFPLGYSSKLISIQSTLVHPYQPYRKPSTNSTPNRQLCTIWTFSKEERPPNSSMWEKSPWLLSGVKSLKKGRRTNSIFHRRI